MSKNIDGALSAICVAHLNSKAAWVWKRSKDAHMYKRLGGLNHSSPLLCQLRMWTRTRTARCPWRKLASFGTASVSSFCSSSAAFSSATTSCMSWLISKPPLCRLPGGNKNPASRRDWSAPSILSQGPWGRWRASALSRLPYHMGRLGRVEACKMGPWSLGSLLLPIWFVSSQRLCSLQGQDAEENEFPPAD